MQIELENFKTWRKKTIDFPSNGNVLLNGVSGVGKSSILEAIYFAISGKGQDLITHGGKSMKVILTFFDLQDGNDHKGGDKKKDKILFKITRTKRSNTLVYEDENIRYDDDAAQAIIDEKFGSNFLLTSYLRQKSDECFLQLGPTDKEKFLEKLAFGGSDITKLKNVLKEKIKCLKDTVIGKTAQLSVIEKEAKNNKKPKRIIEIPTFLSSYINEGKKVSKDIGRKNGIQFGEYKSEKDTIERFKSFKKKMIEELKSENKLYNNLENELLEISRRQSVVDSKQKEITSTKQFIGERNTELVLKLIGMKVSLAKSPYDVVKIKEIIKSISDQNLLDLISNFIKELTKNQGIYEKKIKVIRSEEGYKNLKDKYTSNLDQYKKLREEEKKDNDCSLIEIIEELRGLESKSHKESEEELVQILKKKEKEKEYKLLLEKKIQASLKDSELKELTSNRETIEGKIEDINSRINIKKCPHCNSSVKIYRNELSIVDKNPIKSEEKDLLPSLIRELESLKKKEQSDQFLKKEIFDLKERLDQLDLPTDVVYTGINAISEIKDMIKLIKEIKILKEKKVEKEDYQPSEIIKKMKENLVEEKKKMDKIKPSSPPEETSQKQEKKCEEEIMQREELEMIKLSTISLIDSLKTFSSSTRKSFENIEILTLELKELKIKIGDQDEEIKDLREKISNTKENIDTLERKIEENEGYEKQIEEYLEYKKKLKNSEIWEKKVEDSKIEESTAIDNLNVSERMKRKIAEVESLSIGNAIHDINISVGFYLEKFFPDTSISVEVKSSKNIKKGKVVKPGIHIEVIKEGIEVKLSTLSGGERDRVELAFMLSLNRLYDLGIPGTRGILMLDECISSLDEHLCFEILQSIKENKEDKLIIFVSHQTTKGSFDGVIELGV